MSYREKVVKLDRFKDGVGLSWSDVTYDGELEFELSVYRELKTGNAEETKYVFRLQPEDATCAIRTLRRAVKGSVGKLRDRALGLEAEL